MYSFKISWGKKVDTWSENVRIQDDVDVLVDLFNFCLLYCYTENTKNNFKITAHKTSIFITGFATGTWKN